MLGHVFTTKNPGGGQSYQFLHRLSQVLLVLDHGHHVLVDGRSQNNVQGLGFHRHVADHLVVGEHVVPVQHAIVVDALPAQRHLRYREKEGGGVFKVTLFRGVMSEVLKSFR